MDAIIIKMGGFSHTLISKFCSKSNFCPLTLTWRQSVATDRTLHWSPSVTTVHIKMKVLLMCQDGDFHPNISKDTLATSTQFTFIHLCGGFAYTLKWKLSVTN